MDKIVLPNSLKERVLNLEHFPNVAGHPGQTRMLEAIRHTWYWPQMSVDVVTRVQNCPFCANNILRLRKRTNPMKLFPARQPLESVGIDILGTFPRTTVANRFLLVITKRFTKLTQAIPLRNIR